MSTKLRVVLKQGNDAPPMHGSRAVRMMFTLVKILDIPGLPPDWERRNSRQKLEYFAQFLPPPYELVFIRERRHTRKNRSLYLKTIGARKHERDVPDQPLPRRREVVPPAPTLNELFPRMDTVAQQPVPTFRVRAANEPRIQAWPPDPFDPRGGNR